MISNWDDGCTIYDRRYGDTHALNALTAAVFGLLLAEPDIDLPSVSAQLAAEFPELLEPELSNTVAAAYQQLVSCRLVQGRS
ncbi:MAG: HPr-rel-A system PqqD family peptide chaperone [Paucibacter sp.]|nr:HPr-rel-A system PqqD family peptide chaperone [Roseateles sp.]